MGTIRLAAIVPCYGRYERTKRLARQIAEQKNCNKDEFLAVFAGDNCPDFQRLIGEGFFEQLNERSSVTLFAFNFTERYGGYGYKARNFAKKLHNIGHYIFIDNDDTIDSGHFSNYLSHIEGSDFDMVYFNSYVEPYKGLRYAHLEDGRIGHSEIIVRGDMYRQIPEQDAEYGHDWRMIKSILDAGAKVKFAYGSYPTYRVMGVPNMREQFID